MDSVALLTIGVTAGILLRKYLELDQKPRRSYQGVLDLVGDTPMIYLRYLSGISGCKVYGKAEFINPGGSIKDRLAVRIASKALAAGFKGIVEASSGSTGVSLALAALALGLKAKIYVPDDISADKIALLRALGADVTLTRPASIIDPAHICNLAKRFSRDNCEYYYADQFETTDNYLVHYETTGREILRDAPDLDVFVCSAGTGGTMAGVSKWLNEHSGHVRSVLADIQGSALASRINEGVLYHPSDREGFRKKHPFDSITEGVGLNRITGNFRIAESNITSAVTVSDEEAIRMACLLLTKEGLFLGSSSAVNCAAILKARESGLILPGQTVVTILCDSGSRHISKFWNRAYLDQQGFPNDSKA